jgi:hypothetical protein
MSSGQGAPDIDVPVTAISQIAVHANVDRAPTPVKQSLQNGRRDLAETYRSRTGATKAAYFRGHHSGTRISAAGCNRGVL